MENLEGGTLSLEHRYRVEQRRDRHALTTRYHGLQLPFERPVWIKVYDPLAEAGASSRTFDRIKQSAHRAHRIEGPAVSRSLDYGELDRGVPFVVSERISGPSLRTYLEEHGPLAPAETVELAEALAEALEAAHSLEFAHGTLDAEWIFLEDADPARARVDHFCVGLSLDELRRIDGVVLTPDLLRPYPPETFDRDTVPPEQLGAEHDPTASFTPQADLYALGSLLYEAVVGFHPYFEDSESTDASDGIVELQRGEPRPLDELGIDAEFADAIARSIARDPSHRPDSASDFVDELREAVSDPEPSTSSGPLGTGGGPGPRSAASAPGDGAREGEVPEGGSPEKPGEAEPGGPSSILVTLVLGVLVASNVGWFFFYMGQRPGSDPSETPSAVTAAEERLRIDSKPDGAAVYTPGREKPLGRTPLELPSEIVRSDKIEIKIKKTGFSDRSISVRRNRSHRTIRVDLTEEPGGGAR